MKNALPIFVLTTAALYSCQNTTTTPTPKEKEKSRLERAEWLIGRWENNSDAQSGNLSETWVKNGDNVYTAETFIVVGKDTVFKEHSELRETGKTLECAITIPDQNEAKPVVFTMTKQEDNLMVFENPKHDFPTMIRYEHKGDSTIAEISGMVKGTKVKERFPMKKVK